MKSIPNGNLCQRVKECTEFKNEKLKTGKKPQNRIKSNPENNLCHKVDECTEVKNLKT